MDESEITAFQRTVLEYYFENGRHNLPWRLPEIDGSFDPYKILVSEIMLQQTQVSRVIPKYAEFLHSFPSFQDLAASPLAVVLKVWSGLGYNRRAKYIHQAAQVVIDNFEARLPTEQDQLLKLPGVGTNTAGAIRAYAFNVPAIFVETNIRTVYLRHFFQGKSDVTDAAIIRLLERTLDTTQPRIWYSALMDYGSYLKQTIGNFNRGSVGYTRQSSFQGSKRQIRGQIIRMLTARPYTHQELARAIYDTRLTAVLADLQTENLIRKKGARYSL